MNTIGDRIKTERKAKQLTQEELGKLVGVGKSSVSQWESGLTKNLIGHNLTRVASALSVTENWLVTGSGAKYPPGIHATLSVYPSEIAIESNVSHGPTIHGKVPLISWVQAGHALEVVDLLHPGDGFEWIDTTCQIKAHTYALRVQGDSMTPDFPDGCIIVVEPELDPLPGDYVIAKNGDDEATFKQLIKDGADYYLKPLNERYPIKPLGSYRVIGVVRELVRRFR
jgi:SOS-response transcriptional repressor LexA